MADLAINLADLVVLQNSLRVVKSDFSEAEEFSREVADYTGDERLARVVRDFADKWNLRRGFLIDKIERLAAAAAAIHDTFEELDGELTRNISKVGDEMSELKAGGR
jgi:hypothetical protein